MNRQTQYSFSPQAIGWSAAMKDDGSFTMVYIDRELSKWGQPSLGRQRTQLSSFLGGPGGPSPGPAVVYNEGTFASQVMPDANGNPGLQIFATGPLLAYPEGEVWYDAGANNRIAILRGVYENIGYAIPDTNAVTHGYLADLDGSGPIAVPSYDNIGSSTSGDNGTSFSWTGAARRYVMIQHYYYTATTAGTDATYGAAYVNLMVIGDHGLTLQTGPSGASPGADDGFYGGDIIADIIARGAPLLRVVRGSDGIANDGFVVPQAVFNTPTNADAAVSQINQYYLYDYGVYDNRQFFWRPPATGTEWHVRLSEGVQVQDQGPQIETAVNGVIVSFQDAAGTQRYVGPPGFGGDGTDPSLQDTSSSNPVNAYGRKRWVLLQMQSMSVVNAAIKVGAMYLQAMQARPSAGSALVTGFIRDANGLEHPAWKARAGDTLTFDDTSDKAKHYILSTAYTHDNLQNSLTLDATPNRTDWILQRLNVGLSALN
jgi:hypothetical protein